MWRSALNPKRNPRDRERNTERTSGEWPSEKVRKNGSPPRDVDDHDDLLQIYGVVGIPCGRKGDAQVAATSAAEGRGACAPSGSAAGSPTTGAREGFWGPRAKAARKGPSLKRWGGGPGRWSSPDATRPPVVRAPEKAREPVERLGSVHPRRVLPVPRRPGTGPVLASAGSCSREGAVAPAEEPPPAVGPKDGAARESKVRAAGSLPPPPASAAGDGPPLVVVRSSAGAKPVRRPAPGPHARGALAPLEPPPAAPSGGSGGARGGGGRVHGRATPGRRRRRRTGRDETPGRAEGRREAGGPSPQAEVRAPRAGRASAARRSSRNTRRRGTRPQRGARDARRRGAGPARVSDRPTTHVGGRAAVRPEMSDVAPRRDAEWPVVANNGRV